MNKQTNAKFLKAIKQLCSGNASLKDCEEFIADAAAHRWNCYRVLGLTEEDLEYHE